VEKNKNEGTLYTYYSRLFASVQEYLILPMDFSELRGLWTVMENLKTNSRPENIALLESYFTILFLNLADKISKKAPFSRNLTDETGVKLEANTASEVIAYIIENYREDINTASAAAQLNVSPRHLERIIQKNMQSTFSSLLNEYRIHIAQQLICDCTKERSLESIAFDVGYNSYHCFLKQFKLHLGSTPSACRTAFLQGRDLI